MEKRRLSKISFDRTIVIFFILVFLFSYSYKFGSYYYEIIAFTSFLGMSLTLVLNMLGVLFFPIAMIFELITNRYLTFFPLAFTTLYQLIIIFVLIFFLSTKKEKIKRGINLYLVIILGLIAFMTTIINGYPPGFGNWEFTHYMGGILIFIVITTFVSTKKRFRLFCWLLALAIASLAFRLFNHTWSFNTPIPGLIDNNGVARILSFYLFFLIGFFWAEKKNYLKILVLVTLAFVAQSIIQLGSRATVVSVAIAGFFLFLRNITKKSIWVLGGLGLVLLLFFTPPMFFEELGTISKVTEGMQAEGGSIRGRFYILQIGWQIFKEKPILGHGIYPWLFKGIVLERLGIWKSAHNSFIIVAVQMGVFGLVCYSLLFIMSIYLCFKAQIASKNKDSYIYNIANGTMFGVLAIGINQFMLNEPWISTVFIGFGLSSVVYYLANNLKESEEYIEEKIKEDGTEDKEEFLREKTTKSVKKKSGSNHLLKN